MRGDTDSVLGESHGVGKVGHKPSGCVGRIPVLHNETLGKIFGTSFFSSCKVGIMVIGKGVRGKNWSVYQVIAEFLQSSRTT